MANKRLIFIFWALFLVPTVIMAVMAFRLLSHEQERINDAALQALSERAVAVADSMHLTVETVQENLTRSLLSIDRSTLKQTLVSWEETNPLVRNVFVFNKEKGLEYPVQGVESTREERRFINRYEALFTGRFKFDFAQNHRTEEPVVAKAASRQTLLAFSKAPRAMRHSGPSEAQPGIESLREKERFEFKSGWVPWFSENRLCILGWVQKDRKDFFYGVELELMTLLSSLIVDFPRMNHKGAALVLMDGNGQAMHQAGDPSMDINRKPDKAVPVSVLLPHWQIGIYVDKQVTGAGKGFLTLSIILLGIFIAAIVSGGGLLTWQAYKNMKDAGQKTSFVSSVSHELKTPLTSIRMYAELLLSGRVTDQKKIDRYHSVIVAESRRLTRLINNVLDFGKLEQGKKTYSVSSFDLRALLLSIIDAHSIRIKNAGFKIETDLPETVFAVKTDPDAIEQAVLNLVENALKYAAQGKVVRFVLEKGESVYLLKICDRGPGISQKHQRQVFHKFYRIDDSLTSAQPGSGLGLSIARQILRDLGGDLVYEPRKDKGSCFILRIPMS